MRATILKQQYHGDLKMCETIGFWSKTFTDTKRWYSATDRECMSVVWILRTLRPYVESATFVVRSDHSALT